MRRDQKTGAEQVARKLRQIEVQTAQVPIGEEDRIASSNPEEVARIRHGRLPETAGGLKDLDKALATLADFRYIKSISGGAALFKALRSILSGLMPSPAPRLEDRIVKDMVPRPFGTSWRATRRNAGSECRSRMPSRSS